MRSLDVICPVYAEGRAIEVFHARLKGVLETLAGRYIYRVLYVVDPAKDETEEALQDLAMRESTVEVLVMSRRFGHQMALVAGIDASTADAAIMLDSDLQHPPELILTLVEEWEKGGDIVQAVRTDGQETAPWKRVTSRWFYKTFMRVGSVELKPGAADYRLLSRSVVEVFKRDMREHSPFLRGLVAWVGFNIRYVPFNTEARMSGQTKYRMSTLVEFAINGVTSFSKAPLRVCVFIGLLVAMASIIFGIVSVLWALFATRSVPGWPTLITTVTFIGGVQLIFLGVLGEYVAVIFDEVKDRPRYLIARRLSQNAQSLPTEGETVSRSDLPVASGDAYERL
jgi:dolichol-phosphate mannosyltransferase